MHEQGYQIQIKGAIFFSMKLFALAYNYHKFQVFLYLYIQKEYDDISHFLKDLTTQ